MPAEAPLAVGQGKREHSGDRLGRQGLQPKQVAAGKKRRVDVEAGVVRGCADQADHPLLDVGEQEVLLRLVEAVQLVDEEDRARAGHAPGYAEDLAELSHVGHDRVHADEPALRLARDRLGDARLAGPRRPIEEERAEVVLGHEAL
jgi:hypothetical protein